MKFIGFATNTIDIKNKAFSFALVPTIILSYKNKSDFAIMIIILFWAIKFMWEE